MQRHAALGAMQQAAIDSKDRVRPAAQLHDAMIVMQCLVHHVA
jgi:hypothetical protein